MPPAGDEFMAVWREAGEWWHGEPQREMRRFLDLQGIRREEEKTLPSLAEAFPATSGQNVYREDHREEICLRLRKVRDEKVARACGYVREVPTPIYKQKATPYAALHVMSG